MHEFRAIKTVKTFVILAMLALFGASVASAATVNGAVRKMTDSTAIVGAKVYWLTGTTRTDSTVTDTAGAYTLANVATGFNIPVQAVAVGYAQGATTVNLFQATTVATANFYLGAPGSISGKVRKSTDSSAVAGAKVYLRRTSATSAIQDSAVTDSLGNYAFSNLSPGTPNYFVTASAANYNATTNSNIVLASGASVTSNVYIVPILPGSINGKVRKSSDSTAIAGAKIYLRRTSATSAIQDSTVSDTAGNYAFAGLQAGTPNYFVTANAAGFVATTNSNIVVNNGANTVSNVYMATLGKISGAVRKLSDSTAVSNALVLLRRGTTDTSAILDSARTDGSGLYTFANLTAGSGNTAYRVYASAAGFVNTSATGLAVTNGATTTANLYLGLPGSISGKVRKATDSTTIAGALVYLRRTSATAAIQDSATTDSLGNYAFASLIPGTPNYFVTASAANFITGTNSNIVVGTGAAVVSNVYLTPVLPGSITGKVRRLPDSAAVAGAKLYLRRTSATSAIQDSVVSDTAGNYAFSGLQAGTPNYFVTANAAGYAAATNSNIVVNNGANTVSNVILTALGKISGKVRKASDSTSVANALMLLRRGTTDTSAVLDSARTDTAGSYTFSNLAAGNGTTAYRVYASAAGFVSASNTGITVTNGTTTTSNLYLNTPGTISGNVRKATDSTAIVGATVYLRRTSATAAIQDSAITDGTGHYAFANLAPGTPNYFVTASAANFVSATNSNLSLANGGSLITSFYLAPVLPGSITGKVRKSTDSTGIAGAKVYLRRTSATAAVQDSAVSDTAGNYAFTGLQAGTPNYFLTANAAGYAAVTNSNVVVNNGANTVSNLTMTTLGKISGRVRKLSDSTSIGNALVLLRRGTTDTSAVLDSARTDTSGAYTFANLAAGNGTTAYRTYASAAGFVSASNTNITVNNGATATSNFYLGIPGSIAGNVRKSTDSTALAGAKVYLRRTSATSAILDSATTDGAGHYAFASVLSGTPNYWITASLAAYVSGTNANVAVASGASVTSNFYLAPIVAGTISGTVRKAADTTQFIANARVLLRRGSDTSAVLDSARTDSLGHYAFANVAPLTPNYWINASAAGYLPVTNANVAVANGASVTSNFSLALPGTITGKVRGLPDSTALRGALVQMRRGAATTAVLDSARTDSLGNYTFNGLVAATNYRITAIAAGFVSASNTNVTVTAGNPTTSNLTLAVGGRSLIVGKVARATDSTAFKNALVVLRRGSDSAAVVDSIRTDSLGNYAFSNLIPGTPNYWVKVTGVAGYQPGTRAEIALAGNDTVRADFFLAAIVSIRPAAALVGGMRVDRLGDRIVIRVEALAVDRTLVIRDIRGVQWFRATVPAGATQVTVPTAKAPQAGALIRLE